jgi:DNA-binding CsgD family transcriptional regulator
VADNVVMSVSPRFDGCDDESMGATGHCWAATLNNGLGRYGGALIAAERACDSLQELGFSTLVLPELIEAASRSGKTQQAADALEQLSKAARANGSDWVLGIEARCRALLSEYSAAEGYYQQAIALLSRTRVRIELARAHLLYGEWLRRDGRRLAARQQLRIAHDMFIAIGAEAFAERTRRELLATGETARKRTVETLCQLTAQEAQIAQLARAGCTNREIGAELFLSPRTVEWHLRKVYQKLGLGSRRELRNLQVNTQSASSAVGLVGALG